MGKDFNIGEKIQEAGLVLGGLGVIGFLGLIWLMIYGNMSGNLGFADVSITVNNESAAWINATNYTISVASNSNYTGATALEVWANATGVDAYLVPAANYTLESSTGILRNATIIPNATEYNDINLSFIWTANSVSEVNTERVIGNITGGFLTFFGFSNTFFTIAAIILLIFMLLGLLAMVFLIMDMQKGGKKFR